MLSQIPVAVDYAKAGVPAPAVPAALKLMILPNLEAITLRPERPLVLVVPGGGYNHVSAREAEAVALKFLAEGIHAAVLRYSVAPSRWPTAALELAWSLQYIRAHAEIWHVRPGAISVCGCSAGGHLAGTLGTLWNEPLFARVLGVGASWRSDAQILCYSVLTLGEFTHPGTRNCLLGLPSDPDNQLHLQEALVVEFPGRRRGCGRMEDIAAHHHDIGLLPCHDIGELTEEVLVLVFAAVVVEFLAQVPVAGM